MKLYASLDEIDVGLKGRVAVKLHMGEKGNETHLKPEDAAVIVQKITANGAEPFLVDTTTLYKKERHTRDGYLRLAKEKGFGRFEVVVPGDDEWKEVNGVKVAREIAEADGLLLLTHVTGHITTGIGAALKNLGMGCVVKDGKRRIHGPMRPEYDKGMCVKCGACVKVCPLGLLTVCESGVELSLSDCPACGRCMKACPKGAMKLKDGAVEESFRRFAEAAKAVTSLFAPGRMLCINVLKNVTAYCDCTSTSPAACRDIGVLAGTDPLELDLQTAELLRKEGAKIDWKRWNVFEEVSRRVFSG